MRFVIPPIVKAIGSGALTGFCFTVGSLAAKELATRAGLLERENPKEETTKSAPSPAGDDL